MILDLLKMFWAGLWRAVAAIVPCMGFVAILANVDNPNPEIALACKLISGIIIGLLFSVFVLMIGYSALEHKEYKERSERRKRFYDNY